MTVAFVVVAFTVAASWALVWCAGFIHPYVGDLVSILLLWTGIAARDMVKQSSEVVGALNSGSLSEARRRVGMICGRDTDSLDESGIARATVESVAENMVDALLHLSSSPQSAAPWA